jgi:putative intracellular protease/amidase
VLPDQTLADVESDRIGLLILPGGDLWEAGSYPQAQLTTLLLTLAARGIPIAAICGATFALARAGLLNDRRHTSTVPGDLNAAAPAYAGAAHYTPALAVADRGVITASGLGSVEFAREVFAALGVFSEEDQRTWFDMFKHGRLPGTAV